jgi:hypothetical protein
MHLDDVWLGVTDRSAQRSDEAALESRGRRPESAQQGRRDIAEVELGGVGTVKETHDLIDAARTESPDEVRCEYLGPPR